MIATLSIATAPEADIRIRCGRDLDAELTRICLEQFDRALAGLADPDPDVGIHESRKAKKRLRALLRLVRGETGYTAYRQENVVLRDVGRRLAPARDSLVMAELIDDLAAEFPDVHPDVFLQPGALLRDQHRETMARIIGDRQLMADLRTTLACARCRFAARPSSGHLPIRDSFSAVAPGIRRVYRRGRKALRAVQDRPTEGLFHEWRKRVKYLRYQVESLQPIGPEAMDALAIDLERLGELLGREHDHAVLEGLVFHRRELTDGEDRRRILLALAGHRRAELQREAVVLGRGLYAEPPADFVGRIGALWDGARSRTA
jgi:CHAD domain-containing protein